MKAQLNKRYALIQNGRCHWKFDITMLPEWADTLQTVDITDLIPEPDEGDVFDGVNFTKPPVVAPPARIRHLTIEALADLLESKGIITQQEREAAKR